MQYPSVPLKEDEPKEDQSRHDLHAEEDGRNKEWEDRARVNLETVPEGTRTNIERDFEPGQETPQKPEDPAY